MTSPLGSAGTLSIGLLLLRLPLGAYMFMAGFNKIFKVGVGEFARGSLSLAPSALPDAVNRAYLHALPFAELLVGALLLLGLFTRYAALVNVMLLVSILVATGITGGTGPFHHATMFLGASLMLALVGPGRISLDGMMSRKPRRSAGDAR